MALETANYIGNLVATNPAATDPKAQGDDHLRMIKSVLLNSFAGFPGLVVATGAEAKGATVNDYVVTITTNPVAYTTGMVVFKPTHTNSGAVTLGINALLAKSVLSVDGSPLEAGDIESGTVVVVFYDGTNFLLISGNDRAARSGDSYTGTHDFSAAVQVLLPANTSIGAVSSAEIAVLDGLTASTAELNVLHGLTASTAELNVLHGLTVNTSDLNSVTGKAPINSPTFTGNPAAPTPASTDDSTNLATTAFVKTVAFNAAVSKNRLYFFGQL